MLASSDVYIVAHKLTRDEGTKRFIDTVLTTDYFCPNQSHLSRLTIAWLTERFAMIHITPRTASYGYSARCYVVVPARHSSTRTSDLLYTLRCEPQIDVVQKRNKKFHQTNDRCNSYITMIGWLFHARWNIIQCIVKRSKQYANSFSVRLYISRFLMLRIVQ